MKARHRTRSIQRTRDWSPATSSFPLVRSFRLLYWSDLTLSEAKIYAPHVHPHHQLTLICSGQCRVLVDERWFTAKRGHCFYIPAGTKHGFQVEKSKDNFRSIQFRFHIPAEAMRAVEIPARVDLNGHDALLSLAEEARENLGGDRDEINLMLGQLQVMSLLLRLSKQFGRNRTKPGDGRRDDIEKARTLMHQRYAEPITVPMLAQASNLSASRLSQLFSDVLGLTPMAYLREIRLNHARRMLAGTEQSVNAIALAVGYASHHYFSRDFRARVGLAPTEYRSRTRDNPNGPVEVEQTYHEAAGADHV